MKTLKLLTVVPAALVMSLTVTEANLAEVPRLQIQPNVTSEALVLNGISGGTVASNCGNIANAPNQIIQLTQPLPYLRLTVDSPGQPTLLIDGPGGSFCVLSDNYSGSKPELTGYFMPGEYTLHVGELSQSQYNYTLSISQQKSE
ncbi:hypothetical protein PN465_00920 [Nodularia spumigena CS-584]|jgi:hypothetical protein|uniref:Uncharacterized protein n=2 Tax=Nodularia spumigena TaxID=70799 RepID=A0A2S0Q975_NODSP|nr:hypothetical protein [Nodularia spumigena]AHJ29858.1 hypothetical protein NSP_35350 [Nodularia spumigena CCY9414]AVZ31235.1 hypothetical protein BMF81_03738 [Nodularia spumigena UHCC 0039]EAW44055.1 hypothetical protein N9414_09161 [Nodularia spumigena CCY9414]MDB9380806.1 hypothetical protein [Nodularia spumigena CS-584]MEA5527921.1 hypothetical protein [Nodularia spumigena UHCC 0143]